MEDDPPARAAVCALRRHRTGRGRLWGCLEIPAAVELEVAEVALDVRQMPAVGRVEVDGVPVGVELDGVLARVDADGPAHRRRADLRDGYRVGARVLDDHLLEGRRRGAGDLLAEHG